MKKAIYYTSVTGLAEWFTRRVTEAKEEGVEKFVLMTCDCFWNNGDDSKERFFFLNPINTFRFSPEESDREIEEALRRIEINQWSVIVTNQPDPREDDCRPNLILLKELRKRGFVIEGMWNGSGLDAKNPYIEGD